jgi:hypothetical protein
MLMRSALFWDITQRRLLIPYRRFGTVCQSVTLDVGSLKMGPKRCPETSLKDYHSSLRNISEERKSEEPFCCLGGLPFFALVLVDISKIFFCSFVRAEPVTVFFRFRLYGSPNFFAGKIVFFKIPNRINLEIELHLRLPMC